MSEHDCTDSIELGVPIDQLLLRLDKLGLASSKEILEAYCSKERCISVTVDNIKRHTPQLNPFIGIESCEWMNNWLTIEGWIEYLAIVCIGLGDILALFLNHAFSLNVNARSVQFSNISKHLEKASCQDELLGEIRTQIGNILNSDDFKYISNLNNHVKHNDALDINVTASMESDLPSLKVKGFTHHNQYYSEVALDALFTKIRNLQNEYTDIYRIFLAKE